MASGAVCAGDAATDAVAAAAAADADAAAATSDPSDLLTSAIFLRISSTKLFVKSLPQFITLISWNDFR